MERRRSCVLLVSQAQHGALCGSLGERGFSVTRLGVAAEAARVLATELFDAVLMELSAVGDVAGLSSIHERYPDVPVVACGKMDEELSRAALAAGACELLTLPFTPAALDLALSPALAQRQAARPESADVTRQTSLLGASPQMAAVRERIRRVAGGTATVLVRGETGTGKELVARALHAESQRRGEAFVRVHASALPDALLESELFGYEKGAFTGATARKPGRVELAEKGTLFFDEIGEISPAMQVKLLRLIQEREYERLGGTRTLSADVRFVAATHRDLEHMVEVNTFREDLFYRLNVVSVWLPPLRARREDIPLIAEHYLQLFRANTGNSELRFDEAALRLLAAQRWPGNVRQLVNFVERLVVLAHGECIGADDVRRHFAEQMEFLTQAAASQDGELAAEPAGRALPSLVNPQPSSAEPQPAADPALTHEQFSSAIRPLREDIRRAERRALLKALQYASGNRALAARMLGVSRRTLYTKLEEHGID